MTDENKLLELRYFYTKRFITYIKLLLEYVWQHFAYFFLISFIIVILLSSGLLLKIPSIFHIIALIFLFVLFVNAILKARHFELPKKTDVLTHLEEYNRLRKKILHQLDDKPIHKLNSEQKFLWNEYKKSIYSTANSVTIPPFYNRYYDRHALFAFAILGSVLVYMFSPSHFVLLENIKASLQPNWNMIFQYKFTVPNIEKIWISYPDYTKKTPLILNINPKNQKDEVISVLENSIYHVIILDENDDAESVSYYIQTQSKKIKGNIKTPFHLKIKEDSNILLFSKMQNLANHQFKVIKDKPAIFTQEPFIDNKTIQKAEQFLDVHYKLKDDYGLKSLQLLLKPTLKSKDKKPYILDLLLSNEEKQNSVFISAYGRIESNNPMFSGETLTMQARAIDGAGHITYSKKQLIKLPMRVFKNLIALQLVELRKAILDSKQANTVLANTLRVLNKELQNYKIPANLYLKLSQIEWQMRLIPVNKHKNYYIYWANSLWKVANLIEYYYTNQQNEDIANVNEVHKKLLDALTKNASQEEINQLLQNLESQLMQYFAKQQELLAKQNQNFMNTMQEFAPTIQQQQMEVQQFLQMLKMLIENKKMTEAAQLLNQMQQNLQQQNAEQMQKLQQLSKEYQDIKKQLEILRDKQQSIAEHTYKKMPIKPTAIPNTPIIEDLPQLINPQTKSKMLMDFALSKEQNILLNNIKAIKQDNMIFQVIAAYMKNAEQEGKNANQYLQLPDFAIAYYHQGEVIKNINLALDALKNMMQQQLQNTTMPNFMPQNQQQKLMQGGQGGDLMNTENIGFELPDGQMLKEIEIILKELQKRASDNQRSKKEQDYIKHILKKND